MRTRRTARGAVVLGLAGASLLTSCTVFEDDTDAPLLACARPTEEALRGTVSSALDWLDRALQDDGRFWYEYDRSADTFSEEYHDVRHAGTLMSIYQVAASDDATTSPDALVLGDEALVYVLDGLAVDGDRTAFLGRSRAAELGSTALAIAALVHRRIATDDGQYDELLRSMGRFMDSLRRDDGGMWARATADGLAPIEGQTSTFYTGEAFWAYGLLANQFEGQGWDAAAEAVGRYIVVDRDAEEEIENPPHPDQWSAYGFAEMREWAPLDGEHRAYIRKLYDKYSGRVGRELEREALRVGDGSGPPDDTVQISRGAGFGTTVEALASLWRLTSTDPGLDDLPESVRGDLICGAQILAARQVSSEQAAEWPRPEVVRGAWFDEGVSRVDDQQHAMSGVLLAVDALAP